NVRDVNGTCLRLAVDLFETLLEKSASQSVVVNYINYGFDYYFWNRKHTVIFRLFHLINDIYEKWYNGYGNAPKTQLDRMMILYKKYDDYFDINGLYFSEYIERKY